MTQPQPHPDKDFIDTLCKAIVENSPEDVREAAEKWLARRTLPDGWHWEGDIAVNDREPALQVWSEDDLFHFQVPRSAEVADDPTWTLTCGVNIARAVLKKETP